MNVIFTPRDYGLLGRDAKLAEKMGLASAQWYQCPMPRKPNSAGAMRFMVFGALV